MVTLRLVHFITFLFLLVLDQFQPSETKTHYPDLGTSLTLGCTPPRSYPPAEIFWATFSRLESLRPIDLTDRISIDPDGKILYFLKSEHF